MVRTFVCAVVALLMVAGVGLAQDKGGKGKKGTTVNGTIKKVDATAGTLTVAVKGKKGEEPKDMQFTISDETKVTIWTVGAEKATQLSGKSGLKNPEVKEGTQVRITTDPNTPDKVTQLVVGKAPAKPKKDK